MNSGWQDNTEIEEKSAQIYNVLVKNYNEILAMKDQVKFIKSMLKSSKASERKFNSNEIKRLKGEQEKLKEKMDRLFDLRLDGELDRESFDIKRNDIQVKIERIKRRISAHEKADNSFDETILGLLDIATQAGYIFEKSSNVDLKRLLLKFVFENITLTEGEISYKLKFPFNEFVNTTILRKKTTTSYELMQSQANQSLHGNDNEKVQSGYMKSCELSENLKNQGLAKNFANPLQSGWKIDEETEQKSAQLYCVLVNHRSEILEMKEQVQLIRSLLAA